MVGYLGIDPGQGGAAAIILTDGSHEIMDWPKDVLLASDKLISWRNRYSIAMAAIEKVSAMPGQGVVSMFSFGQNLGQWQGILATLRIPHLMPTPQAWQKGLVDKKAGDDNKAASLATARRLFPNAELHLKKHHGRSDALLLAYWAKREDR